MKILVYGYKGWIGSQVLNLLKNSTIDLILGNSRLENYTDLENEILKEKPDRIISVTGRTHGGNIPNIDYLELDGKLVDNIRDNLYGPLNLANLSKKYNIHYCYLGTGCIFEYDENKKIFTEEDIPNFFGSSYSIVKGFTDNLMKGYDNVLNLRIRMPIVGKKHHRNFITKILGYEYICSIQNSMSVLPTLLPIMIDMVFKKNTGTFNLTNPGVISHNEILNMYKEFVDPNIEWKNIEMKNLEKKLLSRRSNNELNTSKLLQLYPNTPNIHDAVKECILNMKKKIYRPQNVLFTGCCGFIGSNTINYLGNKYKGINFYGLDKLDYCADIKNVDLKENYKLYEGNINNSKLVMKILKEHNIDTVIHMAAQTHVDNSFGNSFEFTKDNIYGTHVLAECCKNYGKVKKFIHMSTDEVYGEVSDSHLGCTEFSLLNPTNPYAATKASAEFILKSYNHSFKLPIIIVRCNNAYGPKQYPEKIIPKFIKLLKENKKCTIHGNGESKRCFIYVEDVARAFDKILHNGTIGEIYNIGSENEYTVMDITKILIKKIKNIEKNIDQFVEYVEDRKFNDRRYKVSYNKLINLGWKEETNFTNGLDKTIKWYN
jgi:UDP-glucose 4,6-dehydratase